MNAPKMPDQIGYYRACVYSSRARSRGIHEIVAVTERPVVEGGFVIESPRVILQIGIATPLPPDMIAVWGEQVDLNNQVAQERDRLLRLVEQLACAPSTVPDSELDWARNLRDRLLRERKSAHG